MELLANKVMDIVVIDHHKTAQAECEGLPFCIFDMDESGASLAWKHYFPNKPLPRLIRYIKDRDLWRFTEPHSEAINAFIQSHEMSIAEYDVLARDLETEMGFYDALVGGQAIERYKKNLVNRICDTAAFDKNGIPTVNTNVLFSEVPHELCRRYPNAPYAQYYTENLAKNLRVWGARSIGDFDVSEVAKQNGGGGHKNAAGWQQSLSEL
jgi:oligoribonuclease NrnB/cAMP/cGMP phosphodiesterase (DHH superfamily)